jgi:lipopolysaccharide export system ATP-binding protein
MPFLITKHLNQFFGKFHILKSVSFELHKGEVVAFLGPNGAGKTTLLRTVIGLLPAPTYSTEENTNLIFLNNHIVNNWTIHKRVEEGLLYLPQQTSLFRQMTVLDNLKLVYLYHPHWHLQPWLSFKKEMYTWLKKTELTHSLKQRAGTLSGGQKRKLEVVRSILMHPQAIMFDEPFAGVDPKSIYELKKIFTDMAHRNIAVLVSDHNVDQLLSIANKVYVVINGKIVTSGGIQDIINNEYTKEMYFGKQFFSEISDRFL